ncbi:hypothetical protein DFJ74DRAFT_677703 [Hyaloraphidium curvatum]|nr:hypothetical protein DFJ74DRAFT_677703 [Hyaloraphidium curvatum]
MPAAAIRKGELLQLERELAKQKAQLNYGTGKDELLSWTWRVPGTAHRRSQARLHLIYDVADVLQHHSGGCHLLKLNVGRDATALFNGGVYFHGQEARHLWQSRGCIRRWGLMWS